MNKEKKVCLRQYFFFQQTVKQPEFVSLCSHWKLWCIMQPWTLGLLLQVFELFYRVSPLMFDHKYNAVGELSSYQVFYIKKCDAMWSKCENVLVYKLCTVLRSLHSIVWKGFIYLFLCFPTTSVHFSRKLQWKII